MRSTVVVAAIAMALVVMGAVQASAVGYVEVGKEDCQCSPLVARGIVPDPLNQLKEAFIFPSFFDILDQIAMGIKGMVSQIGVRPLAAATPSEPVTEKIEEKEAAPEKPVATKKVPRRIGKIDAKPEKKRAKALEKKIDKKKPVEKKSAVQKKKDEKGTKKRVPQPPRAM